LNVKGNVAIGSTYYGYNPPTDGMIIEGNVGIGTTTPDCRLHTEVADAALDTVAYVQRLTHISTDTVYPTAAGFGVGLEFELETSTDGTNAVTGAIESVFTTPTAGSEDADLVFKTIGGGTLAERWRVTPSALLPGADATHDIGSSSLRVNNLYAVTTHVGDLHLRSEDAWWVIRETPDGIQVINQLTRKKYKMVLEEWFWRK
jgi:hypothetical protein